MESFSINGVVQAEYQYNALRQQVIRTLTQTGEVIHNVFDLDGNRIADYDYDAGTGTSTLIREYVRVNDAPVGGLRFELICIPFRCLSASLRTRKGIRYSM